MINNKYISKLVMAVMLAGIISAPVFADGLINGSVNNIDNNGSFINKGNGIDFNLNGGTTNINWDKLNVAGNESLNFIFNQGNSTAFNKVNSLNGPSVIAGAVNALGTGAASSNIIISNAAGVTFANGAVVNVGALSVLAEKDINVNGLTVKNGNLNFESTKNGAININGIRYDNAGNLYVATKQGDISVANILNANNIDLTAKKGNIYIGAGATNVGGKKIDGVTAEYFAVNADNGKVNVTGKVTVGKDFNIVAKTNDGISFDKATVNTKNGSFTILNDNANAKIAFADSSIKGTDGKIKLVSNNIEMINSKINNIQIDKAKTVYIDHSIIKDTIIKEVKDLSIRNISAQNDALILDGIKVTGHVLASESLVTFLNSDINNAEFIGGSLTADNTKFNVIRAGMYDPLWSDNVGITLSNSKVGSFTAQGHITNLINTSVDTALTDSVTLIAKSTDGKKYNINNASLSGGSLSAEGYSINEINLNGASANLKNSTAKNINVSALSTVRADASKITNINSVTGKLKNLELTNKSTVANLNVNEITNVILNNVSRVFDNLKISKLDSTNSAVTINSSTGTHKIDNIVQNSGSIVLNNYNVGNINSNSVSSYPNGSLNIKNSTVNNMNINSLYTVVMENSKLNNPVAISANSLILNDMNNVILADNSYIGGYVKMANSNLTANKLHVNNCIDAKGGSLNLDNSTIGHHLIMDDTNFNFNNTGVYMNIYYTKSSGNNVVASEINSLVSQLKRADGKLYVGYTPDMGDYKGSPVSLGSKYTGGVIADGVNALDLNNKKLFISTSGDVNINVMNTAGLVVDNSNSSIINSINNGVNQTLKLDKVIAQNNINIQADDLKLASGTIKGLIDSKVGEVQINGVSNVSLSGSKVDSNNRSYIEMTVNSNMYDVYATLASIDGVIIDPNVPVIPENNVQTDSNLANYVNTLNVNHEVYTMPGQTQILASQFAKNVRSLAVDSDATKEAILSEIKNGFRLETRIMP